MKKDNPFTLTFGRQPTEYISRYESTETILSAFTADKPVTQAYLVEGVRGSGKTVMLTTVAKHLAAMDEWVVADLNPTVDLLDDMAARLIDACQSKLDLLKNGFSISAAGFGIGFNGNNASVDSTSEIEKILMELKKKHKKVIITIDEVAHDQNMRKFASQFQIFVRKEYPVYLLMSGLYENIYAIQNDPALTFLLRTPKIHLEPLSLNQIAKQYARIFEISIDKAAKLAKITKGYAFAFQAFGMLYFEYKDSLSLNEILSRLDDVLDDFVYKKIWESLPENERKITLNIPEDEIKVSELCGKIDMKLANFSKYRERLIKKGIIVSTKHGYVASTLPRFSIIAKGYAMF